MSINAYTFESTGANDFGQLAPHSAAVDARVRRDLFLGNGDLIVVGDRNGWLNKDTTPPSTSEDTEYTFIPNNSVTFMAGGRLFSITDENITITMDNRTGTTATSTLIFDINTKDANNNFVKQVSEASYPTIDDTKGAYELDAFSSVFHLVIVFTTGDGVGGEGRALVYPAPETNGQNAAGSTSNICRPTNTMFNEPMEWRGELGPKGDELFLSQSGLTEDGYVFTLSGWTKSIISTTNDDGTLTLKIPRRLIAPYNLDISDGAVVLWRGEAGTTAPSSVPDTTLTADIATGTVSNDEFNLLIIDGLQAGNTTFFEDPGLTRIFILANFTAAWNYDV